MSFASSSSSPPVHQCHSHRLQDLNIRAIIDLLDHEDVQALLATGDCALARAIHPHITRLHFHPHACSREKPRSILDWKSWPSILSQQQSPLIRLTSVKFHSINLEPNFECLPETLTQFSLNSVTFRVHSPDQLQFALPDLTRLSVIQIGVYNPFDQKATFDVQWIIKSVRKCPNISTLKYIPNFSNVIGHDTVVQQCAASLPLLSKLHVAGVSETMALHSLAIDTLVVGTTYRWGRLSSISLGRAVMLPKTLTSLKIGTCDDPTLLNLLRSVGAPCNLLHLTLTRIARGGRFREDALIAISQFTRLESLELTDVPAGYDEPLHQSNDLSMLPRSLKRLSHWFATCPPQWAGLPPNVEFIQSSLRHLVTVPFNDTIYNQVIPKTILSLKLTDQMIRVPLSHLIVLKLVITNDIAARAMSLAPPPTVTTLSVSMCRSVQASVITECLSSWSQLPNLERFNMSVSKPNLASSMIVQWLSQCHPRLRSLSIQDNNEEDDDVGICDVQDLDLEGCSLPISLTYLNLSFKYFTLTLPRTIPPYLREIVLGFREIHLSASSPNLDQWPSTLRKIIFPDRFFRTAKQSTLITRQLMVSAFKALQQRLGKNRCRKYRLALQDEQE